MKKIIVALLLFFVIGYSSLCAEVTIGTGPTPEITWDVSGVVSIIVAKDSSTLIWAIASLAALSPNIPLYITSPITHGDTTLPFGVFEVPDSIISFTYENFQIGHEYTITVLKGDSTGESITVSDTLGGTGGDSVNYKGYDFAALALPSHNLSSEHTVEDIKVLSNPFSEKVKIILPNAEGVRDYTISLIDVQGVTVQRFTTPSLMNNTLIWELDVAKHRHQSSMYFLNIMGADKVHMVPFLLIKK